MKFLFVFLLVFPFVSLAAQTGKSMVLRFGKESKRFLDFPTLRLTISENCGINPDKMTCLAAQSLKLASLKSIPHGKLLSRNPGSVICSEVFHERVVIGKDLRRNEESFCLFKDGSMVDTGTLTYYAR